MPSLFLLVVLSACSSNAGIFSNSVWQASGLQHQHIRALAVNADDPKTLYAGDAQGHVFLSTDSAQSWSEHSAGLPLPTALHALVYNSGVKELYALTDSGIYVSDGTIGHWSTSSALPADSYTALDYDAASPRDLYVGTAHHGVYTSTNAGKSWSSLSNTFPVSVAINGLAFNAHQLWTATSAGVYRSADDGRSWNAANQGLPVNTISYTIQSAAASGGSPNTVYLGTNHGFYRSQNGGASWSASKENLAGTSIRQILIDFRNNSTSLLYIATDAGAFHSDDAGQSWSSVASGSPRTQSVYALAFGADNYSQLYAAADGVYQFPGSGSAITPLRFVAIAVIFGFFFTLYRIAQRGRKRPQPTPFPRSAPQTPPSESEHISSS